MADARFCPSCGRERDAVGAFCAGCGAPYATQSARPPSTDALRRWLDRPPNVAALAFVAHAVVTAILAYQLLDLGRRLTALGVDWGNVGIKGSVTIGIAVLSLLVAARLVTRPTRRWEGVAIVWAAAAALVVVAEFTADVMVMIAASIAVAVIAGYFSWSAREIAGRTSVEIADQS